ncbi:MAG: signal recognition particle-docking protein FtsY [Proteobacteria bacterium]|nr:signal recognition particle-docking protein FtsY [Pseudomonadota bacterium]
MLKFFRRKKNEGGSDKPPSTQLEQAALPNQSDPSPEREIVQNETAQDNAMQDNAAQDNAAQDTQTKTSWFKRLKTSLSRTRHNFTQGIATLFLGKKEIDAALLADLESHLLQADVGVEATKYIIKTLTLGISRQEIKDAQAVFAALKKTLVQILQPCQQPLTLAPNQSPFVLLMIGVNGAGKTTTIGKLAKRFQQGGLSVMLAAGDTFRAAAIEQLQIWGERNQVPVLAQHTGADSASVIFDALQSAKARGMDMLIADTAGRLHTRDNLMDELKKVKRVLQKLDPSAPHEVMLVLDAGIGQNALIQAQKFHEALGVTGITLTKLDGTAKGGIIFAIANKLNLPIRFIGVGEQLEDLRPFDANDFVNALFEENAY